MSAPSCERITSSTASRSPVPGAIFAIAESSSGFFRRGSSSAGMRVKPRSPRRCSDFRSVVSFGSIAIEPRLDRLPQRLCGLYRDFAIRRCGAGRRDDGGEAELRALLEAALGLRRDPEAAGEADLAERGDALLDRYATSRGGDRESHGEIGARFVDADTAGDVDEDVGLPERH